MKERELKEVIWCREQGSMNFPPFRKLKRDDPDPRKNIILDYLKRGDYHDDNYAWDDGLIRAIDEFNIVLPTDFREHILEKHNIRLKKMIAFRLVRKIALDIAFEEGNRFHIELDKDLNILYQDHHGKEPETEKITSWRPPSFAAIIEPVRELFLYSADDSAEAGANSWKISFFNANELMCSIGGSTDDESWQTGRMEKLWKCLESESGMDLGIKYFHLKQEKAIAPAVKRPAFSLPSEIVSATEKIAQAILCSNASTQKNVMISPVSILLMLAVIGAAAKGQSRQEIERFTGVPFDEFRRQAAGVNGALAGTQSTAHIANAIYLSDRMTEADVNQSYIDDLRTQFAAEQLSGGNPVQIINQWVNRQTKQMIPSLVSDEQKPGDIALLNAVAFEDKWKKKYDAWDIEDGIFHAISGRDEDAVMLHSVESMYIWNEKATGFIKPYLHGEYAFVGLLPSGSNKPEDILDLSISQCFALSKHAIVDVTMPEFTFDYASSIRETLKSNGIQSVFSPEKADISNLLTMPNSHFTDVLHKTHISVDRAGTRAAAVTAAFAVAGCAPMMLERFEVILDRPFAFAILHTASGLPLFQGIVNSVST